MGMPTMLEYLLYLVLSIVIYQYWVWQESLAMVSLEQCQIKYGIYLHP